MFCYITDCKHNRRKRGNTAMRSAAWDLLHICACCAMELFPNGYTPENGRKITFKHSNRCSQLIREELEQLKIEDRRKLAEESKKKNSPTETVVSQIKRS